MISTITPFATDNDPTSANSEAVLDRAVRDRGCRYGDSERRRGGRDQCQPVRAETMPDVRGSCGGLGETRAELGVTKSRQTRGHTGKEK